MPFVETRFISPTTLTTSASSALYTVPTGYSAIIKQLVVTNITGTAATFTFYIGAASAGNALFSGTSVAANDTVIINLSQVLTTGEVLRALASAGSALNLTVSGVLNDGPLASTATYIADNAITSAKIADGAIVNADINASAAIDKTKISGTSVTVADTGTVTSTMILDGTIATADIAANAITQAKLSTDIPLSGFRNVIINGGFDVWQRSTSATTTGADSYASADRWRIRTANGGGSILSSRQSASLAGFQYCMRFQRVSGNTDTGALQLIQTLETPMSVPLAGRDVTVSFWARKGANYSPTSSAFKVYLQSGTSTDAYWLSFTGSANLITQTTTLTSTWQKFSFTAAAGSTATQFYLQFEMTPTGTAGANDYFEITGVQLEANPQPTPFEQRPIGVELTLCQRYYWRNAIYGAGAIGGGGTVPIVTVAFKTPMRASPTITYVSGGTTMNGQADLTIGSAYSGLPVRDLSADGAELLFSLASGTFATGQPVTVKGAIMQATAEL